MTEKYSELTEPTIEGKVRQLIALISGVPLSSVGLTYSWKNDLQAAQLKHFNLTMAEALTSYFNVPTEASDIAKLSAFWQVVNRITCANNH